MKETLQYEDLPMEVGAASAVIEEFNTCLSVLTSLVSGYYSHKHRQRTLKPAMVQAQAAISAAEKAAQRLDRLLMLEMAPEHFEMLTDAVRNLQLRTEAAVAETQRYAPAATPAPAGTERGVSVESAVSGIAAELASVDHCQSADWLPPSPHKIPRILPGLSSLGPRSSGTVRPVAPHGKGTTGAASGSAASSTGSCLGFSCMRHPATGEDTSSAPDGETGGGRGWVDRGRCVLACIAGTVCYHVSAAQRKLLHDALEALGKVCTSVDEARSMVRIAQQQQMHYVRPPLFGRVAEALYNGEAKIVVVYGAPALGKSALADEIRWLVDSQSMLAEKFDRTSYYLCTDGKCENYADVYRSWTGNSASADRTDFEIIQDLADAAGTSASLLVLDDLQDPACFYQHGALSKLVRRLGTSSLLITTSNPAVGRALLPGAICFELTCAENEKHVMFKLAVLLARGGARRADAGAASPAVKVAIRSCVEQCQGMPHLLKLIDSAVRFHIMDPELHSTANTLSDDFKDAWQACAAQPLPSAAAAQAAGSHLSTYDTVNHKVYLHLLRQVTAPPRGYSTPTDAARMAKVVLRAVVHLNSRQWYPWEALAAAAAEEAQPGVLWHTSVASSLRSFAGGAARGVAAAMPFACTPHGNSGSVRMAEEPGGDDGPGHVAWSAPLQQDCPAQSPFVPQFDSELLADIDAALLLLVQHRVLEMRTREDGQGARRRTQSAQMHPTCEKAELRFNKLLRQCLEECTEARALVGLPTAVATAATAGASALQFFVNNITALMGQHP